jgi:hypothetical protein
MALYNCIYDPTQTQLGFSLKYFPAMALSPHVKRMIQWAHQDYCALVQLEEKLNDSKTHLLFWAEEWEIVWRNSATPTHLEYARWNDNQQIELEFRRTSLHGRIVILHKRISLKESIAESRSNPQSTHPY